MQHKIFQASISADGKMTSNLDLSSIQSGDTLELTINGRQLIGGADSQTLLGDGQEFLPHSHLLELTDFQPQPEGCCRLRYTLRA